MAHTFVWVRDGGLEVLGKLALDRSLHGRRLGDSLLADALARVIDASESGPAARAIVVDAATRRGRWLYARFGFVAAPGRDDRMIVRAETIATGLRQSAAHDTSGAFTPSDCRRS